jgi:hypothetical protein
MSDNQQRQEEYFKLIDRLLRCPNGKEPEILDASAHLLDENFIRTIMQVATIMAHENNQEGSQFLVFIARQLARQLGLYPELSTKA